MRFLPSSRRNAARKTSPIAKTSRRRRSAKPTVEALEDRVVPTVLLADGFEDGQWNGLWVEDSQNDWFTSTQRATEGNYSAEVDGRANNATLSLANPVDLASYDSVELTFDWYIENGFDSGEYLALDVSPDGSSWTEIRRLRGNVDQENTWHGESIDLDPAYLTDSFKLRFRANVSGSGEDGNVDNVRLVGTSQGPPTLSVSDATITEGQAGIQFIDSFISAGKGGLDAPLGMIMGPDGNLYVSSSEGDEILRFDWETGAFMDAFVPASANGGLDRPRGIEFGPDGNLYVASSITNSVLRYDGTTGAFIDEFVAAEDGLDNPYGLTFGPDGNLYVSSLGGSGDVKRFDGTTGAYIDTFVSSGSGGLVGPRRISFAADGNLYVADTGNNAILRYNGTTGAFIDEFVASGRGGLDTPFEFTFGPEGDLYVSSTLNGSNKVLRFQGLDGAPPGAFVEEFVPTGSGGLAGPAGLLFDADGNMYVASAQTDEVLRYGPASQFIFTVSLSSASSETITVEFASADGTATAGSDYVAAAGTVIFAPGETSKVITLPSINDVEVESTETVLVHLSNPSANVTIADGQGVGTIIDDDAAREITIDNVTVVEGDDTPHFRGGFVDGLPGGHFNPITFGPDGNLYTAVGTGTGYNTVQKYDGTTGEFLSTFIDNAGRKLNGVRDIVFREGYVYVASAYTDEVLRYEAATGEFVDVFVTANSGGIDHPDGMAFGPDANSDGIPELYVTGWLSHSVVRYDGATGAPLGTYITSGSGGLNSPFAFDFGPDGVYVTSAGTNQILKYDTTTGAFLGVAASEGLDYPRGLTFGPDGLLYVSSGDNDRILHYEADGTFLGDYVAPGSGGLDNPRSLVFKDGDLYVTATGNREILRFGTTPEAVFTVTLTETSTLPVTVDFATADGSAVAGSDYTARSGTLTFNPGVTTQTILVPVSDDTEEESAETFFVQLSNATGASISDSLGEATINDDDAPPPSTKFYVVDDSVDDTFEYRAEPIHRRRWLSLPVDKHPSDSRAAAAMRLCYSTTREPISRTQFSK